MSNSRDIEDQAARWLIRLDLGDSPAVREEFQKWLASGPKNHATFLRLEKSWCRADYLKNVRPLDGEVNENVLDTFPGALPPEVRRARAERPKRRLRLALAAAIAFLGLLAALWTSLVHSEWQVFQTDLGGFQRIALQDGSVALLNTNSELRVRLTGHRRLIELTRGEALFTVAHDPSRPFDVRVGDTVVRAVGTAFSVRLRNRTQVDVIVTEGRVAIDPPDDSLNRKIPGASALPQLSTIAAGQTARIRAHNLQIQRIDNDDVGRKLAWTKGRIWFDRVPLSEAVAEFNRYNRRQLMIDDPEIQGLRVAGAFDAMDLDSFIAALGAFGIRAVSAQTTDDPATAVIHLVANKPPHP